MELIVVLSVSLQKRELFTSLFLRTQNTFQSAVLQNSVFKKMSYNQARESVPVFISIVLNVVLYFSFILFFFCIS